MARWDQKRLDELFARLRPHLGHLHPGKTRKLWTRPRIPPPVVREAARWFAPDAEPQSTLVVCDTTRLQRARAGYVVTGAAFYAKSKGGEPKGFRYTDLESASYEGKKKDGRTVVVGTAHGELRFAPTDVHPEGLKGFIDAVLEARAAGLTDDTERLLVVAELADEALLGYLQVIVDMTRADGRPTEPREWAEVQQLLTRLRVAPRLRAQLGGSLGERARSPKSRLEALAAGAPAESHRALGLSLVKDAIQVHGAARPGATMDDLPPYIRDLGKRLNLTDEAVALVVEASAVDQALVAPQLDRERLAERAQELAARAEAHEVPLGAAFVSGSPLGLDVATVARALAELELATELGVASLATADGTLLLLTLPAEESDEPLSTRLVGELIRGRQRTQRALTEELAVYAERVAGAGGKRAELKSLSRVLTLWCDALEIARERCEELGERVLRELAAGAPTAAAAPPPPE